MNRRDAIYQVAGLMGATLSTPFLMGLTKYEKLSNPKESSQVLISDNQRKMIEEIAQIIIPTTGTPGAKEAGVPDFIIMMIEECYAKKDQERFYAGLDKIDETAKSKFSTSFLQSKPEQKTELLKAAETDARNLKQSDPKAETPFFPMIKELTVFGYFTSEIGCTQALAYVPVPGSYKACEPLKPGQKVWAM